MALSPAGTWAYGLTRTPRGRGPRAGLGGPEDPRLAAGDRPSVTAHRAWRAADATLGWWGPDGFTRLVVATADPGTLPGKATWYLATNLPRPGGPREAGSVHPAASLAEITRIYGIRHWIEQSYKQVKDELGWADFQVRSDTAIRRHQVLVNCAFSFCWAAWFAESPPQHGTAAPRPEAGRERGGPRAAVPPPVPSWPRPLRAVRAWLSPWIVLQRWWAACPRRPASAAAGPDQLGRAIRGRRCHSRQSSIRLSGGGFARRTRQSLTMRY